jgi:hypothetical protein
METSTKWILGGVAALGIVGIVVVATRKPALAAAPPGPAAIPPAPDKPMISTRDQPEWNEGYTAGHADSNVANPPEASIVEGTNPYRDTRALMRQAWLDGYWSGRSGGVRWHAMTAENWAKGVVV